MLNKINNKVKTSVKVLVSIGLLIYLINLIDWEMVKQLEKKSFFTILIGAVLNLLILFIMSIRLRFLLKVKTKKSINKLILYVGYLRSSFFSMFLPGTIGGDVYRIKYVADKSNESIVNISLLVVVERVFGVFSVGIIFSIGLLLNDKMIIENISVLREYLWLILLLFGVVLVVGFIVLHFKFKINFLYSFCVLGLSFFAQFIDICIASIILVSIVGGANPVWMLLASPLAYIITILPISFGGLGVRESVLAGVLKTFGVDISLAVIVSLMIYLSKVFSALISGVYSFWVIDESKISENRE